MFLHWFFLFNFLNNFCPPRGIGEINFLFLFFCIYFAVSELIFQDVVSTEMQRTTELKLCTDEVNHITHRCKSKSAKEADESETALLLADEMLNSEFCLLPERSWYRQTDLTSALSAGCIPGMTNNKPGTA